MKSKWLGSLLILCIVIISCNPNIRKESNDLLTSTKWTTDYLKSHTFPLPEYPENHTFHKNGDYTFEGAGGGLVVIGQWKWIGKDEIYVQWKSITVNDVGDNFDEKQSFYMRILEISKTELRTLVRDETDTWESGHATDVNYKSVD